MELKNKARFWTGIGMGMIEVIGLAIYGLTLIDWSWMTFKVALASLISVAIILYNVIAGILIWNGSGAKRGK